MLEIRTFRSERKGIRVDLHRKYKHSDPATGKTKFSYKQLGSFSLSEGYPPELLERLQLEEIVQLQNWLAEARFAAQFQVEADALAKFMVRLPQKFYDALLRLYTECKRVDINFIPNQVMLESLLHKAKLVQNKLDRINGFSSGILESIGISTANKPAERPQVPIPSEDRALFEVLLNLNQPIGKTCSELEEAAKRYGKHKRIPPPQLREWAGDMPSRNPAKRIKGWAYAIAIDVLHQHGINPLDIIAPRKIAEYWATQKQQEYTLEEAKTLFSTTFKVPEHERQAVLEAITQVYKKVK